ncbi:unnamed protein product [Rotaria magnacalcarata]|uniref:Uncharacterized protein n=3 Tax=Rotaria magnacalcarata TaxID=392030 RepID=A0A815RY25_9BILA|nr:unnamed protein product [Rotaria magnacalcarata]
MLSTGQSSRRQSSTDELEKSFTQYQSKTFDNEQRSREPVKTLNGKQNQQEKSRAKNHDRSTLKRHSQKELAHADFIQRAIRDPSNPSNQFLDGLATGKQRKTSNTSSNNNLHDLNEIFDDENNDWFFEKLLDKFENIRGKTSHEYVRSPSDDVNNNVTYGPERIIERRYYINKTASLPKCNQLTSTTDLTKYREKTRQISGVSSLTAATTYSRGSTSAPAFIENLHQQSDLLRHEISDLRNDIEQLQTSQDQFFKQMKSQFQSSTNTTATSQNFAQPTVLSDRLLPEKKQSPDRTVIPSSNSQRARSVSAASTPASTAASSEYSDLTLKIANKANFAPLSKPVVPAQPISQFIATKNSTISPTPLVKERLNSKFSSTTSSLRISEFIATKNASLAPLPPLNSNVTPKPESVSQFVPPKNQSYSLVSDKNPRRDSKSSSAASTPTNTKVVARKPSSTESESSATIPAGPANTKPPSISRTPSVNSNVTAKPPSIVPTPPVVQSVASENQTNLPTSYQNPLNDSESSSAASTPTNIKVVARKSSSTESESESESLVVIPTGPLNTKPPSAPRTPLANNSLVSKSPSITATSPLNTNVTARSPSIELTPSMTQFIAPKKPSTEFTGSAALPVLVSSPIAPSSIPSAPMPIYENELACRRGLSPRSQIVASSAPVHESSDSSDGSTSPELVSSVPAKTPTVPRTTLQDNELKALAHYSSQLELSGFTPSINPVIANPNSSTTFWESVDNFIANNRATHSVTGLPPVSRPIDRSGYRLNNSVTKILDKYNLEIKPQEIIESSAPLLMPPLDTLP